MHSLQDILQKATIYLQEVTDSPRREACLLMAFVLNKSYEDVYFGNDLQITNDHRSLFEKLLKRRLKREPLSKIKEYKEFWSLPFRVTADTLDPRPDSEILIEAVLKTYPDTTKTFRILDLGTGTGCLLLSLLHQYPNATGIGIDISEAACRVAQENAHKLKLNDRASFIVGNWGDALNGVFDIIVSNPPYIGENEPLPTEVAHYDPPMALYAGHDGLDAYRAIANQVSKLSTPQSKLFLEMGKGQFERLSEIFINFKLSCIYNDLSGTERAVVFCPNAISVN
jgi:release factor glutamine methyltransferase